MRSMAFSDNSEGYPKTKCDDAMINKICSAFNVDGTYFDGTMELTDAISPSTKNTETGRRLKEAREKTRVDAERAGGRSRCRSAYYQQIGDRGETNRETGT